MKNLKRTAMLFAISLSLLLVASCKGDELPRVLETAKRPLTLITKGSEGILVKDGDNNLYSFGEGYYFARTVIASSLKPGDVIIDN